MTQWVVTGAGGQLGTDLVRRLAADGADVRGFGHAELDVTDRDAVRRAVAEADVVVNTAAWTDVDGAESDPAGAAAANAVGPQLLAEASAAAGAILVHISTDYVFAGDARRPYREDDAVRPLSAYGRSKAAGESAVLTSGACGYVVRSAWLFGGAGRTFVRTIARLERERDTLEVVDDQRGCPTWTWDLAGGILALVAAEPPPGVYHCTNAGQATWCELARAVFAELGADPERVRPVPTTRVPRPAARPAYSVLSTAKWAAAGLPQLQPWRTALHAAFSADRAALPGGSG